MTLMTRIHYLAQNFPDTRWGEHEIDYVLVVKKDVDLDINRRVELVGGLWHRTVGQTRAHRHELER